MRQSDVSLEETDLDLDLGRLAPLVGFHLRMASAAVARDFARAVSDLDLTQKQYAVLELVAANAHVSQADVARALGSDRATMMAVAARLETRGLLARQRSARDGRRQELRLTEAGRALLVSARGRIRRHEDRFIGALGKSRADTLIAMLDAIYAWEAAASSPEPAGRRPV